MKKKLLQFIRMNQSEFHLYIGTIQVDGGWEPAAVEMLEMIQFFLLRLPQKTDARTLSCLSSVDNLIG